MKRTFVFWLLCAVLVGLGAAGPFGVATSSARAEVGMPNDEYARMDPFERHRLEKADKVFAAKKYRQAVAEYDAFMMEFPNSPAVPYVLFRKARATQLDGKRFKAIDLYEEYMDFFDGVVRYAAASLYYMGESHWQNGDIEDALKVWSRLARHEAYSNEPLAAGALNQMADHYWKTDRADKAVPYYWQVAVNFRTKNAKQAEHARNRVIEYYVRRQPNEKKLREFYVEVKTFDRNPRQPPKDPIEDGKYWNHLRGLIKRYGRFNATQKPLSDKYYQHWLDAMGKRFPGWDDFHLDRLSFQFAIDGDRSRWTQGLDELYERNQKAGDQGRTLRWLRMFAGVKNRDKVMEYYQKLDFAKMSQKQVIELMKSFWDQMRDTDLAKNTFAKLNLGKMSDGDRRNLARYFWHRSEALVMRCYEAIENRDYAKSEMLEYYHWKNNADKGLPLAKELTSVERYAERAWWVTAELHQRRKQWKEAIGAYQAADNPPNNLYRISECYAKWGKLTSAVGSLREIENFFKKNAPDAGLKIAYLYRDAGKKDNYISELRKVLKKYPRTGQASRAHVLLEQLGVRTGGGVDDE